MKKLTSKQCVEAKYKGCALWSLRPEYKGDGNYTLLGVPQYMIRTARGKIIGTGKTERAAWINAAKGIK